MSLEKFREDNPAYDDWSDNELMTALHDNYGKKLGLTFYEHADMMGYHPDMPDETEKRQKMTKPVPEDGTIERADDGTIPVQESRQTPDIQNSLLEQEDWGPIKQLAKNIYGSFGDGIRALIRFDQMGHEQDRTVRHKALAPTAPQEMRDAIEMRYFEGITNDQELIDNLPSYDPRNKAYKQGIMKVIEDAGTGMARFWPTMVLAPVSPTASYLATYAMIAGDKYHEYRYENKYDHNRAMKGAHLSAALQAPIETASAVFQVGRIGKMFKGHFKGSFINRYLTPIIENAVAEGLEEVTQKHLDVIADAWTENPNATPGELWRSVRTTWNDIDFQKEALYEWIVGSVGGALIPTGTMSVKAPFDAGRKIVKKVRDRKTGTDKVATDILEGKTDIETATKTEPEDTKAEDFKKKKAELDKKYAVVPEESVVEDVPVGEAPPTEEDILAGAIESVKEQEKENKKHAQITQPIEEETPKKKESVPKKTVLIGRKKDGKSFATVAAAKTAIRKSKDLSEAEYEPFTDSSGQVWIVAKTETIPKDVAPGVYEQWKEKARNFRNLARQVQKAEKTESEVVKDPITGKEFTAPQLREQMEKEGKNPTKNDVEFSTRRGYTEKDILLYNKRSEQYKKLLEEAKLMGIKDAEQDLFLTELDPTLSKAERDQIIAEDQAVSDEAVPSKEPQKTLVGQILQAKERNREASAIESDIDVEMLMYGSTVEDVDKWLDKAKTEFKTATNKKTKETIKRRTKRALVYRRLLEIGTQIKKGTWRYQQLYDATKDALPSLELVITSRELGERRWKAFTGTPRLKDTRGTTAYRHSTREVFISLNLDNLQYDFANRTESTVVHELIHAYVHSQLGGLNGMQFQQLGNAIRKWFWSIPKANLDQLQKMADSYGRPGNTEYDNWLAIATESFLDSMYLENYHEAYTYIFSSDPLLIEMSKIQMPGSRKYGAPPENLWARLVRIILNTVTDLKNKVAPTENAVNQLVAIMNQHVEGLSGDMLNFKADDGWTGTPTIIDGLVDQSQDETFPGQSVLESYNLKNGMIDPFTEDLYKEVRIMSVKPGYKRTHTYTAQGGLISKKSGVRTRKDGVKEIVRPGEVTPFTERKTVELDDYWVEGKDSKTGEWTEISGYSSLEKAREAVLRDEPQTTKPNLKLILSHEDVYRKRKGKIQKISKEERIKKRKQLSEAEKAFLAKRKEDRGGLTEREYKTKVEQTRSKLRKKKVKSEKVGKRVPTHRNHPISGLHYMTVEQLMQEWSNLSSEISHGYLKDITTNDYYDWRRERIGYIKDLLNQRDPLSGEGKAISVNETEAKRPETPSVEQAVAIDEKVKNEKLAKKFFDKLVEKSQSGSQLSADKYAKAQKFIKRMHEKEVFDDDDYDVAMGVLQQVAPVDYSSEEDFKHRERVLEKLNGKSSKESLEQRLNFIAPGHNWFFEGYYDPSAGYAGNGFSFRAMDPDSIINGTSILFENPNDIDAVKAKVDERIEMYNKFRGAEMQHEEKITEEHVQSPDDYINKIYKEYSGGVREDSFFAKFKDVLKGIWNLRREFSGIDWSKRGQFAEATTAIRKLMKQRGISAMKATKELTQILDGLTQEEYEVLEKFSFFMDLYEQVELNAELPKDEQLKYPFGLTESQIEKEVARLFKLVYNTPSIKVAWEKRLDAWHKIRSDYMDAMEDAGFDVRKKLKRTFYFRHQVLDYLQTKRTYFGISGSKGKLAVPTRRSHLKKRKGGTYAMNLNLIQADFEVMAQLIYDTEIAKTLSLIMDKFGSKEYKEGYVEYRPIEGTVLFLENTIPDFVAQQLTTGALTEFGLKKHHIKQVLAIGGKYQGYYIPEELMEILKQAHNDLPTSLPGKLLYKAQTYWKQYQLLNPLRLAKYNLRNLTGDAEAMFVGNPRVFAQLPRAFKEVINWKLGKPSPLMEKWLELGGQDTLLQAQEMNKIIESPNFKKYNRQLTSKWNPQLIKRYWKVARAGTDMREAWMRFAAFIHYSEQAQKGEIKNYGGSFKDEVDALSDPFDKAFMLSNDLLGAYDRISQGGDFIKKYLYPFWSFQEINMDRTAMFFRNALKDDKLMGAIGRKLGAKTAIASIKLGKMGFRLLMLSGLMAFWNNWMFPDEERALPEDIRRRSHFILGVSDDGTPDIYYFPRVGILGDLLEWGGADTFVNDMFDIMSGKRKAKDIVKEFTRWEGSNLREKLRQNQFTDTVINKLVQGVGPQYKIPLELSMGVRLFPDIFKPSPYGSTAQYIGEQLSLKPFADKIIGAPQKKDWLKETALSAVTYRGDVARLGYINIQDKKDKFLRQRGLKGSGFIRNENASYLYNIGLAYRYGDTEALAKFYTDYIISATKKMQEPQDLEKIWNKIEPLYGIPEKWKTAFLASLEPADYKNLFYAYKYYLELKSGKQFMEEK